MFAHLMPTEPILLTISIPANLYAELLGLVPADSRPKQKTGPIHVSNIYLFSLNDRVDPYDHTQIAQDFITVFRASNCK